MERFCLKTNKKIRVHVYTHTRAIRNVILKVNRVKFFWRTHEIDINWSYLEQRYQQFIV